MRIATTFKEQSCEQLYRIETEITPLSDWMSFSELIAWAMLNPELSTQLVMPSKEKLS